MAERTRTTMDLTGLDLHGPQIIYVDDTGVRANITLLTRDTPLPDGQQGPHLGLTKREHALIKAMLDVAKYRIDTARIIP